MPNWNSRDGVWTPAKEKVALTDENGSPFIYQGKDRAALEVLKNEGEDVSHLGMPFSENPDIIERAHDRNMSVDKFCKTDIHTKEKREKIFKENEARVVTHVDLPKKDYKDSSRSGGSDTTGSGNDKKGGFGEAPDLQGR